MRSIRALTAVLLAAVLVGPLATPARAEPCTDDNAALGQRLNCWANTAKSSRPVLVTLKAELPALGSQKVDLAGIQRSLRQGPLVVSVPKGQKTGQGGTLLLILAARERRLVAPSAEITPLSPPDRQALENARICSPNPGLGDPLCQRVTNNQVPGEQLLKAQLARELGSADIIADIVVGSQSGGGFTKPLLIGTAAALLLALLGFFLLRLRPASAPAGGRSPVEPVPRRRNDARPVSHRTPHGRPPTGRRRSATVRTDLHPQGYVELDQCLYRAAWADEQEPPPPPGGRVDVVEGTGADSDLLLAYPPRALNHL